jgi:sentrin-specific protease 1
VSLGTHWTLAVVNFKEKRFEYYDSLGAANQKCIDALRKWIQDESADKKKKPFDISDWTDYSPLEIPHQVNGWDCGVFMCRYADCQTRDVDYDFSQAEMPYFRRRMILEIVQKKLFDV